MNSRLLLAIGLLCLTGASPDRSGDGTAPKKAAKFRTELVRGKVVWLGEVLKSQFDIAMVPEAMERNLAIQTAQGDVLPLFEDLRGRSFRTDPQLRGQPMELLVRRFEQQPMLQVIRIYELQGDKRYELDYWCDVCAIVMFEKGVCACCQDDNRLRRRLVPSDDPLPAPGIEPRAESGS